MQSVKSIMINSDLNGEEALIMLPHETDKVYSNMKNKFIWSIARKTLVGLCDVRKMEKHTKNFAAGRITVYLPKKELEEMGILDRMVEMLWQRKDVRNVKVVEMRA